MNTRTVTLTTSTTTCDIVIGSGLLGESARFASAISGRQVFVVTSEAVAARYLESLTQTLAGYDVDSIVLPDGEATKRLAIIEQVIGEMLARGHRRGTTVVALGGGVVGDTAGFAAATFQRGVNFIQVPTTLLAQVDSSVGGKTAVNHPLGKNMIGAFWQPATVVIDVLTLRTLPAREVSAGLAEIIKHAILASVAELEWLETAMPALRALETAALIEAVERNVRIKAEVVAADEREAGLRATLNLGHTFGHAIESTEGYGTWLHGEAVGAGLVMAADLSMRMGLLDQATAVRIKRLVAAAGLPVVPPLTMTPDDFEREMARDKKAGDAGVRFVVIERPGRVRVTADVPESGLAATLAARDQLCGELV